MITWSKLQAKFDELQCLADNLPAGLAHREYLADLILSDIASRKVTFQRERMNAIVETLFPKLSRLPGWTARSKIPIEEMPRWPDKAWWWNGASLKDDWEHSASDGHVLRVESYVGRGDVDEAEILIPAQWLVDDDYKELIAQRCLELHGELQKQNAEAQRQKALRDLEDAQRRVAQLQDGGS